jgi:methylthioribulose-1-phosphate dehydratase
MAPSGVDKGRVQPASLILVDDEGSVIGGRGRVSAEMQLHRTIVHETGAGAVLHTHSQAATLLSQDALTASGAHTAQNRSQRQDAIQGESGAQTLQSTHERCQEIGNVTIEGLEMLKGLEGIHTHQSRIAIPVLPNDQDLRRLSEAARPHLMHAPHGILIAGHGLYAWGDTLEQARRHLEILEFLLEQHFRQRLWNALMGRQA